MLTGLRCEKERKKRLEAGLVLWMKKNGQEQDRVGDGISRTKKERERERERYKKREQDKGGERRRGLRRKCTVMIYLSLLFCCTPNLTETLIHV